MKIVKVQITIATAIFFMISSQKAFSQAVGSNPAVKMVEMRSISFYPKTVTISEGQSVQWKNVSYTDHSATSSFDDGKGFDTNMVEPGKISNSILFPKKGKYVYHCKIHGRTMSGIVVVRNPI